MYDQKTSSSENDMSNWLGIPDEPLYDELVVKCRDIILPEINKKSGVTVIKDYQLQACVKREYGYHNSAVEAQWEKIDNAIALASVVIPILLIMIFHKQALRLLKFVLRGTDKAIVGMTYAGNKGKERLAAYTDDVKRRADEIDRKYD
ncbi:hypothetical protein ACHMW7_29745 [Aminobacter sp. UC22_36]|uniref:hypothetical protein n=1 Tax=Aminobacter sp. UC22_36 TaxID=3374549 RepID=UPI003757C1CB